jgi:pyridoxamine 5'-phosphate oxidase
MNQKNSLGIDLCFKDLDNPIDLFVDWFNEAKKTEINDPNALALATVGKNGTPSVRMVLLKDFNKKGFVFYTNLNSQKSNEIKSNPNASMCFHWKSILRQVRITGKLSNVPDEDADNYYNSRSYGSRIGAWASNQSSVIKSRDELLKSIEEFKKKYKNEKNIPRPKHWSGWNLNPIEIEFWLDGKDRIHERLRYTRKDDDKWEKDLLSP